MCNNEGGAPAASFLRSKLASTTGYPSYKYDGYHVGYPPERLAALTLAKHPPKTASQALGELVEEGSYLALFALSYVPAEESVPVLHKILLARLNDSEDSPRKESMKTDIVTLLGAIGMRDSLELLKSKLQKPQLARLRYRGVVVERLVEGMESRLSIPDRRERSDWTRQELDYWRGIWQAPPLNNYNSSIWEAALILKASNSRFTPQFLRSRLSEPLAVAIAGVQREASLASDLKAIERDYTGGLRELAQEALVAIDHSTPRHGARDSPTQMEPDGHDGPPPNRPR